MLSGDLYRPLTNEYINVVKLLFGVLTSSIVMCKILIVVSRSVFYAYALILLCLDATRYCSS